MRWIGAPLSIHQHGVDYSLVICMCPWKRNDLCLMSAAEQVVRRDGVGRVLLREHEPDARMVIHDR
jgi:hypothetical protein